MTPIAACFNVVHDETAIPQHSRNTERNDALIGISGIHDAVVAQMSPSGSDGALIDNVVNDFPAGSGKHVDRIGPCFITDDDA